MLFTPRTDRGPTDVKAFTANMRENLANARAALQAAQERQAKYANLNRRDFEFKIGDKAWLAATHLKLPKAANAKEKLLPRFYGPYEIIEVISPVAYRLKLPKNLRIHPVIHISHLKASADGTVDFPDRPEYKPPPTPEVINNEEYFSIEAIRKHEWRKGKLFFRVKWTGYGEEENSWLPANQMESDMTPLSFQELICAYKNNANIKNLSPLKPKKHK